MICHHLYKKTGINKNIDVYTYMDINIFGRILKVPLIVFRQLMSGGGGRSLIIYHFLTF